MLADAGYVDGPFANEVKEVLGMHVTAQIARRDEMHSFHVIPKRWVVKRSFAWQEKSRLQWKNCERWLNTSMQFVHLAFVALLLRRS